MPPHTKRQPEAAWLQRKAMIEKLFLREGKSQAETRQMLEEDGFYVSKSQLEHKLQLWGFRKKLAKNTADEVWELVNHLFEKREKRGKASELVMKGKVIPPATIKKERSRRRPSTLKRLIRTPTSPQAPEGQKISVYTPPPMCLRFPWPKSLPWLQFQASASEFFLSLGGKTISKDESLQLKQLPTVGLFRLLGLPDAPSAEKVALLTAKVESMMPEAHEDENVQRVQLILTGSFNEASIECVKMILYLLSNHLNDSHDGMPGYGKNCIVDLLNNSGITRKPLALDKAKDPTFSAIAENLFQHSFCAVAADDDSWNSIITWLLSSGQSPNTAVVPISIDKTHRWTPLQCAMYSGSFEVALELLEAKADPKLKFEEPSSPLNMLLRYLYKWFKYKSMRGEITLPFDNLDRVLILKLVNLLLDEGDSPEEASEDTGASALMLAAGIGDLELIDILIIQGQSDIFYYSAPELCSMGDIYVKDVCFWKESVLGCAARLPSEESAMACIKHLLRRAQSIHPSVRLAEFVKPDVAIAAASKNYNEVLKMLQSIEVDITIADSDGFSALHSAAYFGHLDTCQLLLGYGALVNNFGCSKDWLSPLHLAALNDDLAIVKLLHQHGAHLDIGFIVRKRSHDWKNRFWNMYSYKWVHKWDNRKVDNCLINSTGAAILGAKDYRTYRYLVSQGAKLPEWAAYYGSCYPQDLNLVQSALAGNANVNWQGPSGRTPLQAALLARHDGTLDRLCDKTDLSDRRAACVGTATELLNSGAILVGDEVQQAIFLERWDLVELILQHDLKGVSKRQDMMSMLEAALLTTSNNITSQILERYPHSYDPGALCACVLIAISGERTSELSRILRNRDPSLGPHSLEGLAIGIAAWHGALEVLDMLLAKLPTQTTAIFPTGPFPFMNRIKNTKSQLGKVLAQPVDDFVPFWRSQKEYHVDGSPLALALWSEMSLTMLIEHNYLPDRLTLALAADDGNPETLQRLLALKRHDFTQAYIKGPLCCSVEAGHTSIVKMLLDAQEEVNEDNNTVKYGRSPLQQAVEDGNLTIINMLIEAGADVNAPPAAKNGATALQLAAIKGHIGLAKSLIDLGADVNAPPAKEGGRTALEGAAEHGRIDMISFLLNEGAITTGKGQQQYLHAVKLSEEEGHGVAAGLLKSHRKWTPDDHAKWKKLNECESEDEEDCYEDEEDCYEDEEDCYEDEEGCSNNDDDQLFTNAGLQVERSQASPINTGGEWSIKEETNPNNCVYEVLNQEMSGQEVFYIMDLDGPQSLISHNTESISGFPNIVEDGSLMYLDMGTPNPYDHCFEDT